MKMISLVSLSLLMSSLAFAQNDDEVLVSLKCQAVTSCTVGGGCDRIVPKFELAPTIQMNGITANLIKENLTLGLSGNSVILKRNKSDPGLAIGLIKLNGVPCGMGSIVETMHVVQNDYWYTYEQNPWTSSDTSVVLNQELSIRVFATGQEDCKTVDGAKVAVILSTALRSEEIHFSSLCNK